MTECCPVCTDEYGSGDLTCVPCEYCPQTTCRGCVIANAAYSKSVKCINKQRKADGEFKCQIKWTRAHLKKHFTRTWVNKGYKDLMADVYLQIELAKMPATMEVLAERKIQEDNVNKIWDEMLDCKATIKFYQSRISDLNERVDELQYELTSAKYRYEDRPSKLPVKSRTIKCATESCRGFVDGVGVCALCEMKTCTKCRVSKGDCKKGTPGPLDPHPLDPHPLVAEGNEDKPKADSDGHICDPTTLETIKLILKQAKPCPKCITFISKVDGCDQMWCTECHTAFSWKTGKVEYKIHNPHFWDYTRKMNDGKVPRVEGDTVRPVPGEPVEIECVDINHNSIVEITTMFAQTQTDAISKIDRQKTSNHVKYLYRFAAHIEAVVIPQMTKGEMVDNEVDNQKQRIRYLKNDITKDELSKYTYRAYKKAEKAQCYKDALNTFVVISTELVSKAVRLMNYCTKYGYYDTDTINDIVNNILRLVDNTNNILYTTSCTFDSVLKQILISPISTDIFSFCSVNDY